MAEHVATVGEAELRVSLPDGGGRGIELELRRGSEVVATMRLTPSAGDASSVRARIGDTTAELEVTGTDDPRARGTVGGVELPETGKDELERHAGDLPEVDLSGVAALPVAELTETMRTELDGRLADPCQECTLKCGLAYVKCLAACGDPGTIPGAICWIECMIEGDKCTKACPCDA